MKPLFHAQSLDMMIGGKMLIHGLDFFLSSGDLLMVTGPNGVGKSTLLRGLAGLLPFTHGQFAQKFEGGWQNMSFLPLKKRAQRLAYVGQCIPEDVVCTVEEMVMMGRSPWQNIFGQSTAEDTHICMQTMEQMDVLHLSQVSWQCLSGGERQRTLIARALCQTPRLLLLDEPTSALDYRHQQQLLELLKKQCDKGLCVVMITHDLNLAALYADTLILMGEGQNFQGKPSSVLLSETLEQVYHCHFCVDEHPCGCPRVSLMRERL